MPSQKMTHNPIECAKCGRGKRIKIAAADWYGGSDCWDWICCKHMESEKPDPELSAARADPRQMGLPL